MLSSSIIFTEKILGRGNNGDVIEALYNGESVAVKRVKKSKHMIEREIMENYNDSYINHTINCYQNEDEIFLVQNILKPFNPRYFSRHELKVLIYQIISGICFLHNNKIIHNDIKLENILYDSDNRMIKINDFSHSTHFNCENTKMRGTLTHIAPEITKYITTPKSDIWSLGCLLFEIKYGYSLFSWQQKHNTTRDRSLKIRIKMHINAICDWYYATNSQNVNFSIQYNNNIKYESPVIPPGIITSSNPLDKLICMCLVVNYEERKDIFEIKKEFERLMY